ncbi:MAG TPA: DUF1801 domain-containing protein [Candidatus Limnocylindrales bacterium]|nr:DUF1801 domain-containing protein [Candidatus Limnocylindrales bacterium]
MKGDLAAAKEHIESLPEPRRSQIQHLHELIVEAIPDADVTMFDYSGPLIGYGTYDYTNSRGDRTGRWFSVGLANRKGFISLYSMAQRDGSYYVETLKEGFGGAKTGRSCLNITKPELVDDDAVRKLARESWDQYRGGFTRFERKKT